MKRKVLNIGITALLSISILLLNMSPCLTTPKLIYSQRGNLRPNVAPYIDALDCIEVKGAGLCDTWDTSSWPHFASIAVKDSIGGVSQATVKFMIEGKGDPVVINGTTTVIAGKPPKSGVPMVTFQLTNDISVVPSSFKGDTNCVPTSPAMIVPNNRGLSLEWATPVQELKIMQVWRVMFEIESYTTGNNIAVNVMGNKSSVKYDEYGVYPGGIDHFEQINLNVNTSSLTSTFLNPLVIVVIVVFIAIIIVVVLYKHKKFTKSKYNGITNKVEKTEGESIPITKVIAEVASVPETHIAYRCEKCGGAYVEGGKCPYCE